MKILPFLLFSLISSMVFAQSGTIEVIYFKPMATPYLFLGNSSNEVTLCIAIQFSPISDTTIVGLKHFVKSYMSIETFNYYSTIAWRYSEKCEKQVDVRLGKKDYTFAEFRKLIYE